MKKVALFATIIFAFSITIANAFTNPGKPQGFVNDYANILSKENKDQLESQLSSLNAKSTIQVAVVTVNSLDNETIESYAVKLFEEWGIGNSGKDDGVLFLIAPNERKVRIEVGYGLEGVLTDAQSNGIIQKIVLPEFKAGNLPKGIVDGTNALVTVVTSDIDYSIKNESNDIKLGGKSIEFIIFIFWTAIIFLSSILGRTKSWWLGGVIGFFIGIVLCIIFGFTLKIIITTIALTIAGLIFDYFVSKHPPHEGGGMWPIFINGGGSSSSGGFGVFGGGRSGGGGSSGSW